MPVILIYSKFSQDLSVLQLSKSVEIYALILLVTKKMAKTAELYEMKTVLKTTELFLPFSL